MEIKLPTKADLVDHMGKPLTQSIFLETGYSDFAVYTLKDDHHTYNGKLYPSLKKLFIEKEDPMEYDFANQYLLGWKHWQRMNANKMLRAHFDEWREELEFRLRCKGIKAMLESAIGGNYQAAKFFADKGWDKRIAGRPSKEEVNREVAFQAQVAKDYGADIVRLFQANE